MDPAQYEEVLAYQKRLSFPGSISYERGLEVTTISGFIYVTGEYIIVFGDPANLIRHQGHVMVPARRLIQIDVDSP